MGTTGGGGGVEEVLIKVYSTRGKEGEKSSFPLLPAALEKCPELL